MHRLNVIWILRSWTFFKNNSKTFRMKCQVAGLSEIVCKWRMTSYWIIIKPGTPIEYKFNLRDERYKTNEQYEVVDHYTECDRIQAWYIRIRNAIANNVFDSPFFFIILWKKRGHEYNNINVESAIGQNWTEQKSHKRINIS